MLNIRHSCKYMAETQLPSLVTLKVCSLKLFIIYLKRVIQTFPSFFCETERHCDVEKIRTDSGR